jgi:hypothetical protein
VVRPPPRSPACPNARTFEAGASFRLLFNRVRRSLNFRSSAPSISRPSFERTTMSRPVRLPLHFPLACIAACALALSAVPSRAAPKSRIHELAQQEKAPLLDTLRDLVNIESGSKDADGLARLAALIGERLTRLGGKVEIIEPTDIYRMEDTPPRPGAMVHAEFKGTGNRKIMHCERSEAIHCATRGEMDCFVASLLAMTGMVQSLAAKTPTSAAPALPAVSSFARPPLRVFLFPLPRSLQARSPRTSRFRVWRRPV